MKRTLYHAIIKLITAATVARNAWKFVIAKPDLEHDITHRLLEVPNVTYLHKGDASPECNKIVCGKVLESFGHYFTISNHQESMIEFAKSQLHSTRKSVAKAAVKFLKKYS